MRDFRRVRLACVATGAACAVFIFLTIGLNALAAWGERRGSAYPFKAGEEPLRFLLPSIMGRPGAGRIMITGPSAAAEGLLYEDFDKAFPGWHTYQAAFSDATVNDVLLSLRFIERTYGRQALPEVIVVGGEPRFFNNIPRPFGPTRERDRRSPFVSLVDVYSGVHVKATETGSILTSKTGPERLLAASRFWLSKQQPRWRVGFAALLNRILNGPGPNIDLLDGLPPIKSIHELISRENARDLWLFAVHAGPYDAVQRLAAAYVSPYVFQLEGERKTVRPDDRSRLGHWDRYDASLLDVQIRALVKLTERLNIKLFVVMLPRHPANQSIDESLPTGEFDAALRRALGDTPYLDLQMLLNEHLFADGTHVTRVGAHRVTAEVVKFMQLQAESFYRDGSETRTGKAFRGGAATLAGVRSLGALRSDRRHRP